MPIVFIRLLWSAYCSFVRLVAVGSGTLGGGDRDNACHPTHRPYDVLDKKGTGEGAEDMGSFHATAVASTHGSLVRQGVREVCTGERWAGVYGDFCMRLLWSAHNAVWSDSMFVRLKSTGIGRVIKAGGR